MNQAHLPSSGIVHDYICDECTKGENLEVFTVHSILVHPCIVCGKQTKNMSPLGEAKKIKQAGLKVK